MRQEHGLQTGEYTFKGSTDWQDGTDTVEFAPFRSWHGLGLKPQIAQLQMVWGLSLA